MHHAEPDVEVNPKENLIRAIRHDRPHHVPHFGEGAMVLVDHVRRRPPPGGQDEWGVGWMALPEARVPGAGEYLQGVPTQPVVDRVETLADLPFPDPVVPGRFAGLLDGTNPSQQLVVGQHSLGIFDRFWALLGVERALVALLTHPQATRTVLRRLADWHIGIARGYIAAGVEAAWLADDYGWQQGLMMSPHTWRDLIRPQLARLTQVYHRAGCIVFFHTCGKVEPIIGDLIAAGVDVFNVQPSANDLAALKKRYGRRIAFHGGVDTQHVMTGGTPEQVRQAALWAMHHLGREGGLVLGPDQRMAMPEENVQALVETARQYGRYPLCLPEGEVRAWT
jgi:uroporphyrinogen decarboxylase